MSAEVINIFTNKDTDANSLGPVEVFTPADLYRFDYDNRPLLQFIANDMALQVGVNNALSEIFNARGGAGSIQSRLDTMAALIPTLPLIVTAGGTGQTTIPAIVGELLPKVSGTHPDTSITGFLKTVTGTMSWDNSVVLPNQSGNDGKILQTAGGNPSWVNADTAFLNETTNRVLAGPVSGSPAHPTFRSLVPADLPRIPLARIHSTTPQTGIGSYSSVSSTLLILDAKDWDTDAMFTTNSRLIAKTAGFYWVSAQVNWDVNNVGIRAVQLLVTLAGGGATPIAFSFLPSNNSGGTYVSIGLVQEASTLWYFNANDYVEAYIVQDSGGPRAISSGNFTFMSMHFVSPGPAI